MHVVLALLFTARQKRERDDAIKPLYLHAYHTTAQFTSPEENEQELKQPKSSRLKVADNGMGLFR